MKLSCASLIVFHSEEKVVQSHQNFFMKWTITKPIAATAAMGVMIIAAMRGYAIARATRLGFVSAVMPKILL